jgi:hypothetical protein
VLLSPGAGARKGSRKRTALDGAAYFVEEPGRELATAFSLPPARVIGERPTPLMNRIYGKPEQAVVTAVPANPAIDVVRSLGLEEKLELLRRLREGDVGSTVQALPAVEPAAAPE